MMKKAILGELFIIVWVMLIGCEKEKAVYYSEIKEKENIVSSKNETEEYEQETSDKSGFMTLFGEGSSDADVNGNMVNGGFVTKDGDDLLYAVPNNHFDRTTYVICRRKQGGESDEVLMKSLIPQLCWGE